MSELSIGQLKGLPVNSNVVTVPAGNTLYAPGHVVQVATFSYSTNVTINSTSWQDTNLKVSITPKFSTSKIYISYTVVGRSPVGDKAIYTTVFRGTVAGGVNIGNATQGFSQHYAVASVMAAPLGAACVDLPNTTTETTYTVAARNDTGSCGIHYGISTITLLEIAA